MKKTHFILLGIIIIATISLSVWLYFYLNSPEQICNRICGYNPFSPLPTGGTCFETTGRIECENSGGIYISPDCCCFCIV